MLALIYGTLDYIQYNIEKLIFKILLNFRKIVNCRIYYFIIEVLDTNYGAE